MISTPRVAMRLASSCTVITSGITTSRAIFACSWPPPLRFSRSRSRARRTEARRAHALDGLIVVAGHGLDGQTALAALRRARARG